MCKIHELAKITWKQLLLLLRYELSSPVDAVLAAPTQSPPAYSQTKPQPPSLLAHLFQGGHIYLTGCVSTSQLREQCLEDSSCVGLGFLLLYHIGFQLEAGLRKPDDVSAGTEESE